MPKPPTHVGLPMEETFVGFNIPLHHIIAKKTLKVPAGFVVPELHLIDRNGDCAPYEPLNLYFAKNTGKSLVTLVKASSAVGFFYDYAVQMGHQFKDGSALFRKAALLSAFENHLIHGTIEYDGEQVFDPTGLLWSGHSEARVKGMLYAFDKFASLMMTLKIGESDPLSQCCEGLFAEQPAFMSNDGGFVGFRLLSHLNDTLPKSSAAASRVKDARSAKGIFRKDGIATYLNSPTYRFPKDMIDAMGKEGFVRNPNNENVIERENASGKTLFYLLKAGIRISEVLHMWINDLQIVDGRLVGFLRHPEKFKEPGSKLNRLQVLRKTYGMVPRTREIGRRRIGWKSPGLNSEGWSLLSWLPGTETEVMNVFAAYVLEVRNPIMRARIRAGHPNHPFLLIHTRTIHSDRPGETVLAGDPYSMSAARDGFEFAAHRLAKLYPDRGLEVGKDHGTTPHGLRHHYGHELEEAGNNPKQIQKKMHHKSSPDAEHALADIARELKMVAGHREMALKPRSEAQTKRDILYAVERLLDEVSAEALAAYEKQSITIRELIPKTVARRIVEEVLALEPVTIDNNGPKARLLTGHST